MGRGGKGRWSGKAPALSALGGTEQPPAPDIPSWDGNPDAFAQFVKDCEWYREGLKWSERDLAASRVWHNLRGSARLAAATLKASDFNDGNGLR